MAAYLTQAEASVYSPAIEALPADHAELYLEIASEIIDNQCGRTFDPVIDGVPISIKMATALMAYELTKGSNAGRDIDSEKIGDYHISYQNDQGALKTAVPKSVLTLIAPYKAFIVG